MKKIKKSFRLIELLSLVIILSLSGLCSYLLVTRNDTGVPSLPVFPPVVDLVSGPNATNTPGMFLRVPGLNDALHALGQPNPCAPTEGRFHQFVLGITADETQALIGNSCGSTGILRTFMIWTGNKWERIGSWKNALTRKDFSALTDTPSCTVVDQYKIEASIAPVCFEKKAGSNDLFVGDTTNYAYRLRP